MQLGSDSIGLFFVLLIFASITAAFGWLFIMRPRRIVLDRIKPNTHEAKSILVSYTDPAAAKYAVELAIRFAPDIQTKIILAYVIEVPLSLALNAPMPDREEQAHGALNAAARTAKQQNIECETRMVHDRTIANGLIRLARENRIQVIVIGVRASLQSGLADLVTVSDLFRHAPCELVVAKEPTAEKETLFPIGQVIEPSIRT